MQFHFYYLFYFFIIYYFFFAFYIFACQWQWHWSNIWIFSHLFLDQKQKKLLSTTIFTTALIYFPLVVTDLNKWLTILNKIEIHILLSFSINLNSFFHFFISIPGFSFFTFRSEIYYICFLSHIGFSCPLTIDTHFDKGEKVRVERIDGHGLEIQGEGLGSFWPFSWGRVL